MHEKAWDASDRAGTRMLWIWALCLLVWFCLALRHCEGPGSLAYAEEAPTQKGFSDTFTCTITGYAYGMPDEEPDFKRSDGCQMVQSRVEGGSLVLWDKWYWVRVVLPATGGQQAFWYRWGANRAHLRADDWPIEWGIVGRG